MSYTVKIRVSISIEKFKQNTMYIFNLETAKKFGILKNSAKNKDVTIK